MKNFKKAQITNKKLLFFLLEGTQLNARLRSYGCLQFHQLTLEILNFSIDYLLVMENKTFIKYTQDKRYSGHPINKNEENNRDFQEGSH